MSRPLLVMGAIAAASVCGVWIQATRAPVSHPVRAAFPAERIAAAPVVETSRASRIQNAGSPAAAKVGSKADAPKRRAEVAEKASTPRLGAAMKIGGEAGDPADSGPMLTVEEMQDVARRETEGLVTIRNADGSETLNHEGRFMDYTVIRMGPDGKPEFLCVQGEAAVKRALHPVAPATPKKEDR